MADATASPDPDAASRRRSGRVVKAPEKFSPEPIYAAKRKRGDAGDDDDDDDDQDDLDDDHDAPAAADDDMSDATDAEDSHQHPPRRSKPKAKPAARARKPAVKKPKTNGVSAYHAANLPSRPKKVVGQAATGTGDGDLYSDLFDAGLSVNTVADSWREKYQKDDAAALKDLVNFVLRCCGCELEVTEDDIRDPDNSEDRLTELQELFKEEQISDYPLLSKARDSVNFRRRFSGFFVALIETLHETDILYKDQVLMENISRWIASMSTSSIRPFRHTASTAILSLVTGLVNVAGILDRRITGFEQQLAASQKGKSKAKSNESERVLAEANDFREQCDHLINDLLNITFAHRYRDVDPRIRMDCVEALGHWILALPNVFMQPNHLRYLGWMLSDVMATTRVEVLRQLHAILKGNAGQLGHFIERFQSRLVEMATMDADISVRVAAIRVVDILRDAGLLDPEQVDTIGRLIFDNEVRVRKATAPFFDACVTDLIDIKAQELGGIDAVQEVLPEGDEEDYDSPRQEWLHIKSLAELLAAYDASAEDQQQSAEAPEPISAADVFQGSTPASRIAIAAQALYEKMIIVEDWQLLAGYLLHDHTISAKGKSKAAARSPETLIKKAVAPNAAEEAILLEVVTAAVMLGLTQSHDTDRSRKKAGRVDSVEAQDETALALAALVPRLLSKFGADPATAKIILRMEHLLKPGVFQKLRQDTSRYETLLSEVTQQFSKHDDKTVLAEATASLSHARQNEDLEELVDGKLSVLWENNINALRNFDKTCDLSERGSLSEEHLQDLSGIMSKLAGLASISDPVEMMEAEGRSSDSDRPVIDIIVDVVKRGTFTEITDRVEELEDEVVTHTIKVVQFYFMWKVRVIEKQVNVGSDVPEAEISELQRRRQIFKDNLIDTFSSRMIVDEARLLAIGTFCDLHILFANLGTWIGASGHEAKYKKLKKLVEEISTDLTPELISIFDGVERLYARRAKKILNGPGDDEDPVDDDIEDEDDADDESIPKEQRYISEIKAERAMCDLAARYVMAITRKVLDYSGDYRGRIRTRLLRNSTRLGKNYQEILAYMDDKKREELLRGKKKAPRPARKAAAAGPAPVTPPEEPALEVEDIEDPFEEAEPEEGSREDLRRRGLLVEDVDDIDDDQDEPEGPPHSPDVDSVLGD
ncbi:STAG domain-containing protein [Plectosphaerella plurivora]|uniref:STAG domain-containing protein n=1 Tax=Plectosphaerella plurivora TaxID=936078 RepID=A0A9P8V9S9_9PEZI|nr:STAG domain-containing protein [Plectosphaerella plurivora]